MKKIFLSLIMMVSSIASFAQYEAGTFSIRPEFGFTEAQFIMTEEHKSDLYYSESRYKTGLTAGVELDYQIKKWLGISAGALYSQQGARGRKGVDIKLKYDYLTVPVLANFYPCKGLGLKIGLQPAYLLSAKMTGDEKQSYTFSKNDIRNWDLQLPVGISYEFQGVIVEGRYSIGLVDILKDNNKKTSMHNSYGQITVGYKFQL